MKRISLIFVLVATLARADDLTLSDGTVYKNAKIISHDAVNATILYADGGITVPIAKLPADQQQKLGYDSAKAADAATPESASDKAAEEWRNYRKALDKYAAIDGKLVDRQSSGVLTLNVKLKNIAEVKDSSGQSLGRGSYADIDAASSASTAAPSTIYLKGYVLTGDKPVKIEVVKSGATETGGLYYTVIEPFSFDFWKKAGAPK